MSRNLLPTAALIAASLSPNAFAASLYNEGVTGDLSNTGAIPTFLNFSLGSNQVLGTTGRPGTTIDRDYFTFTVPSGAAVTSLLELPSTTVGGVFSFIGIQQGNAVTVSTAATDATGLLGWAHYGGLTTGSLDLLPDMSIPNMGSSGFATPLGGGTYSVWIQDFNAGTFSYGFDFQIQAVPEPSTMWSAMGAFGLLAVLSRVSRRRGLPRV